MTLNHYDLLDVSIFVTLSQKGNQLEAAQELYLSPSALSLRIKKLEKAWGVKLFRRASHGLAVTPEGLKLLPYAYDILKSARALEQHVQRLSGQSKARLRVASNVTGLEVLLAPMASQWAQHFDTTLKMTLHRSQEALDALMHHEVDLALGIASFANVYQEALVVEPLFNDAYVVLMPADHPLTRVPCVRFSDTLSYPYAALTEEMPAHQAMRERASRLHHRFEPVVEVPSFAHLIRVLEAGGDLLALVPASLLTPTEASASRLTTRALREHWAHRPVVAVRAKTHEAQHAAWRQAMQALPVAICAHIWLATPLQTSGLATPTTPHDGFTALLAYLEKSAPTLWAMMKADPALAFLTLAKILCAQTPRVRL